MVDMKTIPAFTGEFGLLVRYYVPQAHTLCLHEPCIVECEEGTESLFPDAYKHRIVERSTDHRERGGTGRPPDLGVEATRFRPEPFVDQVGGLGPTTVVICPRWMEYGEGKNWGGWPELQQALEALGVFTFAAGAPDSSHPGVAGRAAWHYPRFLDATIEAMRQAALVIATDAGLAHLAVLCGTPLLLVTYRGLVAPGPVIDSKGRKVHDAYWPVRLREYYWEPAMAHTRAPIHVIDGWEDPEGVATRAARLVQLLTAQER